MSFDRGDRRAIDDALAAFSGERDGPIYRDELGPAVYRLEPAGSECMALACTACHTVTIKPGTPRLLELVAHCNNCGRGWRLRPPGDVVAFGMTGQLIVAPRAPGWRRQRHGSN